jgi:hypothetical protein
MLSAEINQIMALKDLLYKFSLSTGLKVNFQKSLIVPTDVNAEILI